MSDRICRDCHAIWDSIKEFRAECVVRRRADSLEAERTRLMGLRLKTIQRRWGVEEGDCEEARLLFDIPVCQLCGKHCDDLVVSIDREMRAIRGVVCPSCNLFVMLIERTYKGNREGIPAIHAKDHYRFRQAFNWIMSKRPNGPDPRKPQ